MLLNHLTVETLVGFLAALFGVVLIDPAGGRFAALANGIADRHALAQRLAHEALEQSSSLTADGDVADGNTVAGRVLAKYEGRDNGREDQS